MKNSKESLTDEIHKLELLLEHRNGEMAWLKELNANVPVWMVIEKIALVDLIDELTKES